MSQNENHWDEVYQIEIELTRHTVALDWHYEAAMTPLASECEVFEPANAQAAYVSSEQKQITKAEFFGKHLYT